MKALVHTAPFELELREVPVPSPGPDEVPIRVRVGRRRNLFRTGWMRRVGLVHPMCQAQCCVGVTTVGNEFILDLPWLFGHR